MMRPWVGTRWGDVTNILSGIKLLILGNSAHAVEYPVGSAPESLLIENVNRFIQQGEKWRFYTVLTTLLMNKSSRNGLAEADRSNVWDSVAFFNYVPVVAAAGPRQPPTIDMFSNAATLFGDFLDAHAPEAILVCGKSTWIRLLKDLGLKAQSPTVPFHQFRGIHMAWIRHPSTGFAYARWQPVLRELIQSARSS